MPRTSLFGALTAVAILLAALVPSAAGAEGGALPPVVGDASVACASPGSSTALTSMCALLAEGTLPEQAQTELAKTIVKLWKSLQAPEVATPEEACALTPAPHPAVPVLCTIWNLPALQGDAREAIGRIVVRLVNGKFELNRQNEAKAAEAKAKQAGLAELKAKEAKTKVAATATKPLDASYLEKCKAYLAERPNEVSDKAEYCRKVVSGEVVLKESPVAPKIKQ